MLKYIYLYIKIESSISVIDGHERFTQKHHLMSKKYHE